MLLILLIVAIPAFGFGGSFATRAGQEPPVTLATQVAVAAVGETVTVTITTQAGEDVEDVAVLWPAVGYVQGSLTRPAPDGLLEIEAFTRPRVEELTCDELVDTVRYRTPPGCASYEVALQDPPPRGEDAAADVALEIDISAAALAPELLLASEVDGWLADRALVLSSGVREGLDGYLQAGVPFIALHLEEEVAREDWLPPVRYRVDPSVGALPLPVAGWAREASTDHELIVYTLHDDPATDAALDRDEATISTDCQLPEGTEPAVWLADEVDNFRGREEAPFVRLHAGPAERCDPCTADLLSEAARADLGVPGVPLQGLRAGRLLIRYQPGRLSRDPRLTFDAPATDVDTRWIERRSGIGFLFPTCREGVDRFDVCPNLETEDTRGCALPAPLSGALGLGLAGVLLLARRRRVRVTGLMALFAASVLAPTGARAADDGVSDRPPPVDALLSVGLAGIDRVRVDVTERAGPLVRAPLLGVEGRYALNPWREGASIGLVAGLRGFSVRTETSAASQPLRLTLYEPSVGLDVRHGRMRGPVSPWLRYGARLVMPVLVPDLSGAQVTVSGLLHVGGGIWVGRASSRSRAFPMAELRLTAIPRSDGLVTTYHPSLDRPGFVFFPGNVNLQLMVGVGFR